jgi:putative CocE/NonD family hydrolase
VLSVIDEANTELRVTESPLYQVEIRYDVRLPVRDGLQLSANLFLPVARAQGERFPAILEMIPYRKDDWRYAADHSRMTYFAQRGYAGCRLDIRGTGSSPGIALDEYTPEETQDGYDAVQWLAGQAWCNGNVGMWGISYGGFTAIQVAMLRPPALKAIIPMYATDDRYTDDVHYLGGCLTASEWAQYAVSQIAMNAMPPKREYAGADWAARWKERLEQTPPWLIEWVRQQTDGPYWRSGSLAPDYERISCAILYIGGWADGYANCALRMQEQCTAAPRKALIGPWVHSLPDSAYPGPNIDYLHEMVRFFDHWLKGADNGVMDEPALTIFRQEYTPPEAFPARVNGAWHAEAAYPIARARPLELYLGDGLLESQEPGTKNQEPSVATSTQASQFSILNSSFDRYTHRPTLGTRAALCYGGGSSPNGLARDLRPDEALSLTYTSAPLTEPLDLVGMPEAVLYLSSSAPVAHVVVRLTDVAPDGTSAHVSTGVLNLTHRGGHADPQPLEPGQVYQVRVPLRAIGYRYLPGQRIRLSVASAYWPVIFPSPYPAENALHRGPDFPSRLILPAVPDGAHPPAPPLKTTPPELISVGGDSEAEPIWQIVEDVLKGSVTVQVYGGGTSYLPGGAELFIDERIDMTAFEHDPARAQLYNQVLYELKERGYTIGIRSAGTVRGDERAFHLDLQLNVTLNGNLFFQKSWLESIPRHLC